MYNKYFGLKEAPFSIAPNPRYLFMSARHREALAHLLYGVGQGGGFVLLTGEVGTGKTTVSRCLLDQLPENTDVALILNPYLNANSLLATICEELGIEGANENQSLKQLTDQLYLFLLENHAKGRHTVLLIDEAQHLKFDVLEQIRLLTNLETNTKKLLQIVFIGQPELNELLSTPELRQLAQRITARFHIQPLTLEETHAYIRHRLKVAGLPGQRKLFPNKIVERIYKTTGGIPRLINVICDRMLLGTYAQNKDQVDDKTFRRAIAEVRGTEQSIKPGKLLPVLTATAGLLIIAAIAIGTWLQWEIPPINQHNETPGKLGQVERNPISNDAAVIADETAVPEPRLDEHNISEQPTKAVFDLNQFSSDQNIAINQLLNQFDIIRTPAETPCAYIKNLGFACETTAVTSWIDFRDINRPAVLTLTDKQGKTVYAPVSSIADNQIGLLQGSELITVNLMQLGNYWKGQLLFIWAPPPFYEKPVAFGDRSKFIKWLADAYAKIDGQQQGLAGEKFNTALAARVKLFQRDHNLRDDGIVGMNTLLKVNERLGTARTLMPQPASKQAQLPNSVSGWEG